MRGPAAGGLLAPEEFVLKNFEISLDWKVPDSGNSGIFLRYLESEASENLRTGPESQVCGKLHSDYKGGMTATSAGACYGMYAPAKPWIRPAEEYNTFRVVMYENRVAHFGNGMRLLEYVIGSEDWKAKYEVSKYASFPFMEISMRESYSSRITPAMSGTEISRSAPWPTIPGAIPLSYGRIRK